MAAALLYSSAGRSWSTRVDGLDRYQRMRVHPLRERQREESPSLELGYHQRTHRVVTLKIVAYPLQAGGLPLRRPLALSHVHGDHIATLRGGRSHLCHLEQQLPAEGAHSPRVGGEGLVLGVLRMRQGGGYGR